jgi:hypothetical protein
MKRQVSRREALVGAGAASAAAALLAGAPPTARAADPLGGPVVPRLPLPVRLYDSRIDTILPNRRKFQNGDEVSINVSAVFADSPSGFALAVFANLTITQTEGEGYLRVVPADYSNNPPVAAHSNINWWQSGITMANSFVSPVGSENSIVVSCFGGKTHVVIDGFAYIPFPVTVL